MDDQNKDQIIGYCGFTCNNCPVFIATQEQNSDMKIELSKKHSLELNEINCYGCTGTEDDKLFRHCKSCEKRRKGLKKISTE